MNIHDTLTTDIQQSKPYTCSCVWKKQQQKTTFFDHNYHLLLHNNVEASLQNIKNYLSKFEH